MNYKESDLSKVKVGDLIFTVKQGWAKVRSVASEDR